MVLLWDKAFFAEFLLSGFKFVVGFVAYTKIKLLVNVRLEWFNSDNINDTAIAILSVCKGFILLNVL